MKKTVSHPDEKEVVKRAGERGISILAMAFMISVTGLFIAGGLKLYDTWDKYRALAQTDEKLDYIQGALQRYLAENGHYPCPAPLTAAIDTPAFGIAVAADCTAGAAAGTFRAAGRDGRGVRTGAVPVRTLGIPDTYSHDDYGQRYVYAVTEEYAVEGTVTSGDKGAIAIIDGNANNATAVPGNIVQIVYSMGWDPNGSYTSHGVNNQVCDPTARSGENCDFDTNATFLNTVNKSTNEANLFVHRISYVPSKTLATCEDAGVQSPKNTAFLVDTSGSMAEAADCPSSMPGCSRIDVARWAMRRVMPARLYNNGLTQDPGQTSMTGFVAYNNTANVENNLGNIIFDDPTAPGYTAPDEATIGATLETELQGMCPSGSTPLGIHIQALADRLGDGDPDRPNRITVISDGLSNNGSDPIAMANYIHTTYPNLEVDIIDVVGNPSLMQVAQITGGAYYHTENPDELLAALYSSAGACNSYTPTPPADEPGCGSSGNWWNNN